MRFLCLVNPVAGGHAGKLLLEQLQRICTLHYPESRVLEMDPAGLESQLAGADRFDCVVAAGGDGTVSRIIRKARAGSAKIAVFPLGTGDDLARELGVYHQSRQLELEDWLRWCGAAPVRELDVWSLQAASPGGREVRFCNYLSLGFDAAVVSLFHRWRLTAPVLFSLGGKWANRAGYALAGLACLPAAGLESLEIRAAAQLPVMTKDLRSLLFTNIRSCMGLGRSNLQSDPADGQLEALLIGSVLNYAGMLLPRLPLPAASLVGSSAGWEIRLSVPVDLQADGEPLGALESGRYRIESCAKVKLLATG